MLFSILRKLFWTDIGAQPVVESASLEGKSRVMVASTNLVSPSGLTIDFTEDRLFWCDLRRGVVETAALDGSHRQVLLDSQVGEARVRHIYKFSRNRRAHIVCILKNCS